MGIVLRPSFTEDLPCASRTAIEHLCAALVSRPVVVKRSRPPGGGRDLAPRDLNHVVLTLPPDQRRFWSPWLTVELSARAGATHLHATFSPHPSVWTGFAFAYLILAVVGAVSLVIAGTAALLPDSSQGWALWLAAGAALAMFGLWWGSQLGQRRAGDQMETLRRELDRALDACRARPADRAGPAGSDLPASDRQ